MSAPHDQPGATLAGIRVVELAQYVFVPSVGAVLADLGADVIRVEHPTQPDPYRGLRTQGADNSDAGRAGRWAQTNRGKRSLGLDLKSETGRAVLHRLAAGADVVLTSFRPAALRRLGATAKELTALNPRLVFARGDAFGPAGPDGDTPGYDITAFWARGGIGDLLTDPGAPTLARQPAAFGDRIAAVGLVAGVLAALQRRERTGLGGEVTTSLLDAAAWVASGELVAPTTAAAARGGFAPLVGHYRCADDRWMTISVLQAARHWAPLCTVLGRPELTDDPRFATDEARAAHPGELRGVLEDLFRTRTQAEWCATFAGFEGSWAPVQTVAELADDPQVAANEILRPLEDGPGRVVRAPFRLDEVAPPGRRGPEPGEHTEEVLLDVGYDWPEIGALKAAGAVT
ncbi:CoA transferase [Pseudonocardia sp. NPDC049154]|uniref:CaiB/BaiF CoA transferase family protein n=1 Tax=Pseudonocardia sp. NPDC049154 TaxID=3155501 RepID=UPI0033EECF53